MKQTNVDLEDESSKDRKREDDKRIVFAVKYTWISLICGCLLFLCGIILFGLVFKLQDAEQLINNKNKNQRSSSLLLALVLKNISPFLCGIGVFSIIISCVVKLEIYQQKNRLREVFELKPDRLKSFQTNILQKYFRQIKRKKSPNREQRQEENRKLFSQTFHRFPTVKSNTKTSDLIRSNYLLQKNIKAHLDVNSKSNNKNSTIQHILSAVGYLPLFLGITDIDDKSISRKASIHRSRESFNHLKNDVY